MDDDDVLNFSITSIINGKSSSTTVSRLPSNAINVLKSSSSTGTKKPVDIDCLIDLTDEPNLSIPISVPSNVNAAKSPPDLTVDLVHLSHKNELKTSNTTNKRKKKTPEEREQEELEKAKKKAQKEQEKEAERQKKLKEREESKKKKLEERRNNKKKTLEECLMEIFIKLDSKLVSSKGGGDILASLQGKDLHVDFAQLSIPHSVEWLRKKDTSFSNSQNSQNFDHENSNSLDSALFEEISSGQIVEHRNVLCEIVNQVLVRITGDILLEMLHNNTAQEFVKNVLNVHSKKNIIFLLEGIGDALKKDNREQTKAMKNGNTVRPPLAKQDIDKFIVWLQVEALCNARQTISLGESIDYIFRLSMAIATAPYRQDNSFSGFCAESVSRASRTDDVWINQLMQISGVSYPVAKAISKHYPSFSSLMHMYESEGMTKKSKEELLASITREDATNGAGRKLGVSISTKIYRVFNEVDGTKLVQDL